MITNLAMVCLQLSRACAFEVRRVMRQRAISVELEPRIEQPCMFDLADLCSEDVEKGAVSIFFFQENQYHWIVYQ